MFEEIPAVRISKRPNAWLRGLQIFVDRYPSIGCCLYSRLFGVKNVSYRTSSACNHYLTRGNGKSLSCLPIQRFQLFQSRGGLSHCLDLVICHNVDVSAQYFLCEFGDFRLFFRDELRVSADNRDFGSHAREEVAEFCCYVSGSYDRDAFGQLCQFEGCVAGMVADLVEAFDCWDDGLGAYAEEDHSRLDLSPADLHCVGCDEFRRCVVVVNVLGIR